LGGGKQFHQSVKVGDETLLLAKGLTSDEYGFVFDAAREGRAGNQLATWKGTTVPSDQGNNLSADPTLPTPGTATWDERNHLASVNAQGAQNFLYDALGRRESESGSIPTATFLYDQFTPVRTTTGSANADMLSMPGTGEVFARTDSSRTMVPLHDQLGSTIGLVNGAGAITTQYTYGPFGTRSMTGAANANPFQFAGMEYDSTGLYHTFARYYSPGLQRFLSEDPLGIGGGDTNIFAYVQNNTVDLVDRLGLSAGSSGGTSGGPGGPVTNLGPGSERKRNGGLTESTGPENETYGPPDSPVGSFTGSQVLFIGNLGTQTIVLDFSNPEVRLAFREVFLAGGFAVAFAIVGGAVLGAPVTATILVYAVATTIASDLAVQAIDSSGSVP
jgi:RHS repeat-associated protein